MSPNLKDSACPTKAGNMHALGIMAWEARTDTGAAVVCSVLGYHDRTTESRIERSVKWNSVGTTYPQSAAQLEIQLTSRKRNYDAHLIHA